MKFLQNVLLIMFGITVALVVAEGFARFYLPEQNRVEVTSAERKSFHSGNAVIESQQTGGIDTVIDWSGHYGIRLNPSVNAKITQHTLSHRDITLTINSLGLRYPELSAKAPGEKRILVLGDSITFGDYVLEDETYTALLEKLSQSAGTPVRFINAGLPGANALDEFYHYLEIADAVDPDEVIVAMYLNDAQRGENPFYAMHVAYPFNKSRLLVWASNKFSIARALLWKTETLPDGVDKEWHEAFRHGRDLRSGDMLNDPEAFDYEIYNAYRDFGLAWNAAAWSHLERVMVMFQEVAQQKKHPIKFMLLPIHIQIKGSTMNFQPQETFKRICSNHSFNCFDTLPGLRSAWAASQEEMLYDHCHYTPRGNRELAQVVWHWLNGTGI